MNITVVRSQKEFDSIPIDYRGEIAICFGTENSPAVIIRKFGNACVIAHGNSTVEAYENSCVIARGNSRVIAWGDSSIVARENSSVEAAGNSQICDCSDTHRITASGGSRIVYSPRTIDEYCSHYALARNKNTIKLYKAVHKRDGKYFSDRDGSFEYVIGESAAADSLTTDTRVDCGHGIHMAHKEWCVCYGQYWDDLAIIEVEAEANDIVMPVPGYGKVRAAKVKVLREVPLDECGLYGKLLAKKLAK